MPNFITSTKCLKVMNVNNCIISTGGNRGEEEIRSKNFQALKSDVCVVRYRQLIACEG